MKARDWEWMGHIKQQMIERAITQEMVEDALNNPDEVAIGKGNRLIYQKIVKGKLLRVVTENNRLITVYLTSKIDKYIRGDKG